ncbi:MAG: NmrA family NAD(P)-binding protein, partial [Rubrivivax sp.]|nr:NmrA family NAD(P)-binding protein [Rubrivivax sp.]
DHPIDFFRTKHAVEQALAASGVPHVVLRPTAFMEQHVHLFNGKGLLDEGKARPIGPGTKPRNVVAAADVARFAVRALLDDPPPFRVLAIGGQPLHGHRGRADERPRRRHPGAMLSAPATRAGARPTR